MNYIPVFFWDEETGFAKCILTDGTKTYTGSAKCHEDDMDMESEKTGCEIAFRRAKISALRGYRDELKSNLKSLNQLYYSMNKSKYFNEKSYENKMLQRQINIYKNDLNVIKETIEIEYKDLINYISNKDKFYNKIRINRKKANSN